MKSSQGTHLAGPSRALAYVEIAELQKIIAIIAIAAAEGRLPARAARAMLPVARMAAQAGVACRRECETIILVFMCTKQGS